jgi:4-hydroxy-tetrahydrodipicolinate synthase
MTLRGVFSAVATPFNTPDQSINEQALRDLVERTIDGGIHGLVPCGSTGEFAAMTAAERKRVLEVTIDQAGGRVPVVAHSGAMTTREAIDISKHAEAAGASAVMTVAPYYEPLDIDETKEYFRSVADSIQIPVIIYNLPVATGVNLEPHDIADIASKSQNVKYVKDTSGDFSQAAKLIHDYSDVISTFVGWDTMFLGSFVEGGTGSIVGAANFIAPQLVSVYDAVQAGDIVSAKTQWNTIFPIMQFLVSGGYVAGVKGALDLLGKSIGEPRAAISALSTERASELQAILKQAGLPI